jgi:hypothetical protein
MRRFYEPRILVSFLVEESVEEMESILELVSLPNTIKGTEYGVI